MAAIMIGILDKVNVVFLRVLSLVGGREIGSGHVNGVLV